MSHHHHCRSCGCDPCGCSPTSDPVSGCQDPGLILNGEHLSTLDDEFCPKRLEKFRGYDQNGDRERNPEVAPQRGFRLQDEEGQDIIAVPPCILFPPVALETGGYYGEYSSNGFGKILGRSGDGCEVDVGGPVAMDLYLKWDYLRQEWVGVPGIVTITLPAPCPDTTNAVIALIAGTQDYTFLTDGPAASWNVKGTINIGDYSFVITALTRIDAQASVSATLDQTITGDPVLLPIDSCVNWSGFIPVEVVQLSIIHVSEAEIYSKASAGTASETVDVSTLTGYTAEMTSILLSTEVGLLTVGNVSLNLEVTGRPNCCFADGDGAGGQAEGSTDTNDVWIKIPDNKIITITQTQTVIQAGATTTSAVVRHVGWFGPVPITP